MIEFMNTAAKQLDATVIKYEGQSVINVEGAGLDAIEVCASPTWRAAAASAGLFMEPINSGLIGVYQV